MICFICNKEMNSKSFSGKIVHWCNDCEIYHLEYFECEHKNNYVVKMIISNGAEMIKRWCNDCKKTYGNSLRREEFASQVRWTRNNQDYHDYREREIARERSEIDEIINGKHSMAIARSAMEFETRHVKYKKYLQTEQWRKIRDRVMKRDNNTCQICGGLANDAHHLTYIHLENEFLFELVALCRECHKTHYHSLKA